MTQPQHDDPIGEARTQLLQGLAVLSTLGEAGARWAAIGMQKHAAVLAAKARRDEAIRAAQQRAEELFAREQRTAREHIERGMTDWLRHADFTDTARMWRTATVYANAGWPHAHTAMGLAQERMRDIHPPFMAHYDRLRAQGASDVDAMRGAAHHIWESQARGYRPPQSGGRPQPGPTPDPLAPGANGRSLPGRPGLLDKLDQAVRQEAGRLAEHVSPEALNALQTRMRQAGKTPAADAAGLLAQLAEQAVREGAMPPAAAQALTAALRQQASKQAENASREAGVGDQPATVHINEHTTAQAASASDRAGAAHDRAAAQREAMRAAFPGPPQPGAVVAHKKPATVLPAPTHTHTHRR